MGGSLFSLSQGLKAHKAFSISRDPSASKVNGACILLDKAGPSFPIETLNVLCESSIVKRQLRVKVAVLQPAFCSAVLSSNFKMRDGTIIPPRSHCSFIGV